MLTFKKFLESDSLDDLPLQLAMRKEFGLSQTEAEEAAEWIKGDLDAPDLECWDKIWSPWEDELANYTDQGVSDTEAFEELIFSKVSGIMTRKYGIEL